MVESLGDGNGGQVRKILKHLDLPACASHLSACGYAQAGADRREVKARPPPKTNIYSAPEDLPPEVFIISDDQQIPSSHDYDDYLIDPEYPV